MNPNDPAAAMLRGAGQNAPTVAVMLVAAQLAGRSDLPPVFSWNVTNLVGKPLTLAIQLHDEHPAAVERWAHTFGSEVRTEPWTVGRLRAVTETLVYGVPVRVWTIFPDTPRRQESRTDTDRYAGVMTTAMDEMDRDVSQPPRTESGRMVPNDFAERNGSAL